MQTAPEDIHAATFAELSRVLALSGIHEGLRFLNDSTACRFAGLYRLQDGRLKNVHLVDKEAPEVRTGQDDSPAATYCALVEGQSDIFSASTASPIEGRAGDPEDPTAVWYFGTMLRGAQGQTLGALCHFDLAHRAVGPDEVALLERAAALFAAMMAIGERMVAPADEPAPIASESPALAPPSTPAPSPG